MKKVIPFFALLALCLGLLGCKSTLEPGGAYAPSISVTNPTTGAVTVTTTPDIGLYTADSAFAASYSVLDLAFKFERDNRLMLWKISPQIKHTLDKIRPGADTAVRAYAAARKAYIANPSPAGLDLLNTILAKVSQAASAASAAIATVKTSTP